MSMSEKPTDDLDFAEAMKAKSDQLNAVNLLGQAITVQITGAKVTVVKGDTVVRFKLSGGHMPWKPCKGMLRVLAEIADSSSAKPWLGKWVTLFRDPTVEWSSEPVGGVRLAAVDASMLPATRKFRVLIGRNRYKTYTLEPLHQRQEQGTATADLSALLLDAELTEADLDRYRASLGKGPTADLSPEQRAELASILAGNPAHLDKIRALIPDTDTDTDTPTE